MMRLWRCFTALDMRTRYSDADRRALIDRFAKEAIMIRFRFIDELFLHHYWNQADRSWLRGHLQEREAGGGNRKLPLSIDSLVVLNDYFRIHA